MTPARFRSTKSFKGCNKWAWPMKDQMASVSKFESPNVDIFINTGNFCLPFLVSIRVYLDERVFILTHLPPPSRLPDGDVKRLRQHINTLSDNIWCDARNNRNQLSLSKQSPN